MKLAYPFLALTCALSLFGCRKEAKTAATDASVRDVSEELSADYYDSTLLAAFDYCPPVDLSDVIEMYDYLETMYGGEENVLADSLIIANLFPNMPEEEIYLFHNTDFALHVPEYRNSSHPFLSKAETIYNAAAFSMNVWSNYEVWYRGNLVDDASVKRAIKDISVDIFEDKDIRKAAQRYKDGLLRLMDVEPDAWREDEAGPWDVYADFGKVLVPKTSIFRSDDEREAFVDSFATIIEVAEYLEYSGVDEYSHYLHYLKASDKEKTRTILNDLASCQNFDEQCSLWRLWAISRRSVFWLEAVGIKLLESGNYSPILYRVWRTWRALVQRSISNSRDGSIPNQFYNDYRKKCYLAYLKHIERCPEDTLAMMGAINLCDVPNMIRCGQNYFGNEAMLEYMMMSEILIPRYLCE